MMNAAPTLWCRPPPENRAQKLHTTRKATRSQDSSTRSSTPMTRRMLVLLMVPFSTRADEK
jgi:hypothetical protein